MASEEKKTLVLPKRSLEVRKIVDAGQIRQSFSHGRSKSVSVEVKKKRIIGGEQKPAPAISTPIADEPLSELQHKLTSEELKIRVQAVKDAMKEESSIEHEEFAAETVIEVKEESAKETETTKVTKETTTITVPKSVTTKKEDEDNEALSRRKIPEKPKTSRINVSSKKTFREAVVDSQRRSGRFSVHNALSSDSERTRSLASVRRAREKQKRTGFENKYSVSTREVIIPETISVQELASRMAVRSSEVIKALMKMGMFVTINQTIDADTAELVVVEFGHAVSRVTELDIELGIKGEKDSAESLKHRPPVVTIMGHVDHGKTSLLDAIRKTDVTAQEAGGITQHIGAYQIALIDGRKITFIDTPGHAAFTAMRARGANVTDIVVLVVAADDGVKEQTVEAIHHAKAANVPIIVAINKIDKQGVNPDRVRHELLSHEIVVEALGGDAQDVEVSALSGKNLNKLEEAILAQAEILDLKANSDKSASGIIIESKIKKGLGPVATVLVQMGTLKSGDIFVSGAVSGRVRIMTDDLGRKLTEAGPGTPVEVIGFDKASSPGDDFIVLNDESRAKAIAASRERRKRNAAFAVSARGSVEQQFAKISSEEKLKELSVVIKADVQGSVEAINGSLSKLSTNEVSVKVLHSGVGGITESDISLALASNALVLGFNVRANPQAREQARVNGIEIKYYSVIYDLIDDVKSILSGLLSPDIKENVTGNAEIRQIFDVRKIGKVAGCMIINGFIKRGTRVRLIRDNVMIYDGPLGGIRRYKDEVKEVREGFECGIVIEGYQDIKIGDTIECYETEEVARRL